MWRLTYPLFRSRRAREVNLNLICLLFRLGKSTGGELKKLALIFLFVSQDLWKVNFRLTFLDFVSLAKLNEVKPEVNPGGAYGEMVREVIN